MAMFVKKAVDQVQAMKNDGNNNNSNNNNSNNPLSNNPQGSGGWGIGFTSKNFLEDKK
jgi:hypothetical protein